MVATISADGLVKRYGEQAALDGFDLEVERGTVFGLLGPNGAGKTTAVRAFATLLRYDAGDARVAGRDPSSEPHTQTSSSPAPRSNSFNTIWR